MVFTAPKFSHEFNLADYFLFDRLSEGLEDKVAILFGDQQHTYGDVAERVRALRGFLTMVGLAREERVLILLHDTPAFVWAFFATLYHGAVVAMGNPDAPSDDLAYLVEYTRATVVITNPRTAESIYAALAVASLRALVLVPEVPTGGDVEADPWAIAPGSGGPSSMPETWSFSGPASAVASLSSSRYVTTSVRAESGATEAPLTGPPEAGSVRLNPISSIITPSSSRTEEGNYPAASAVRGVSGSSPFVTPVRSIATLSPLSLRDAIEHGRATFPYQAPPRRTKRDDVAIWLFTSGSTGKSKAAIHTHRDFAYNTECYAKRTIGYRRDDITVSVSRLFFGYATGTNLMFPFAVGGTTGLFAERPTPEALISAIERYRATVVTNVPTMMSKLLEYDETQGAEGKPRLDLSSVRFHLSAGEALPPALLTRFTARFKTDVYDGIGSAEMFHIYCSNRPGDVKPGSLGRVVEGYTVKILRSEAEGPGEPALPPGETGVMWVKGDSIALGYFQDREKSWATFFGHWCRTGDLFRLDEEGYVWFSGRADDLLKVGGLWVSPTEVEECLIQHPKVALAAVIGAADSGLIKPKAFVVVRDEAKAALATEEGRAALASELKSHVQTQLSKHKYPRWVVFVDDVPRNDRGKMDRKALKEQEAREKTLTATEPLRERHRMSFLPLRIADLTTERLRALLSEHTSVVALVPVGSIEPHGPHLPLGTDTLISEEAAARACQLLSDRGILALLAPAVGYGVTRFADGFAGAISIPATALTAFARAIVEGYLNAGLSHVCLVNNHLEPEHDAAVRAAIEGLPRGRASVACPLTRRWARTLSAEFKSGACHAGRYETSLVLSASPDAVDLATARALPAIGTSLSDGIKAGKASFLAMGLDRAYTGAPAEASAGEGHELFGQLARMIAAEVGEGLAAAEGH